MRLPNNWDPRPYQLPLWQYLESGGKQAFQVAHRRWGKDDVALHWSCWAAQQRIGTYWHLLPQAAQARKAVWDAINPHTGLRRIDEAFPTWLRETTREDQMMIKFKSGSTWQVVGSDNYDSLVGSPPIGVVMSEWALAKPQAWGYIRPILRENGGWALFITTPRGKNHAFRLFKAMEHADGCFASISDARETGVFSPQDLAEERKAYIAEHGEAIGVALFEQEYLCSFSAAIVGAIFGREISEAEKSGRFKSLQHDPNKLVYTSWDLGGDTTAVWFYQWDGIIPKYIDYYECAREKTAHYLQVLRSKPYNYGTVYLPHDADHTRINAEKTIAGQFRADGFGVKVVPNTPKTAQVAAGSSRIAIAEFDFEKCYNGIEALKHYRWNFNKTLGETTETPVHDWASHPADALMCGAVADRATEDKPVTLEFTSEWG